MAVEYILDEIEDKLKSLKSKKERLSYLRDKVFFFKKKRAEFVGTHSTRLNDLIERTSDDFSKYHEEFERGGLIFFNGDKWDEIAYARLNFSNMPLLRERLKLEGKLSHIEGRILLFEAWVGKVDGEDEFPIKTIPLQNSSKKDESGQIEVKPIIKAEAIQSMFDILKDFFSPEDQTELDVILQTGNNASRKLLFRSNGNRLTDAFKKLFDHNLIIGCQKKDLINWIIKNFTFLHLNANKRFAYRTVEKTISGYDYYCKRPLIDIQNGLIQKIEIPLSETKRKY